MGDIVIIGGGVSGLYAGWLLASKGYKCTILEADDRLGGRILTKTYQGVKYECGGSKLLETHKLTLGLIKSFNDYDATNDLVKYPKIITLKGTKLTYDDVIKKIGDLVELLRGKSKAELIGNTIEGLIGQGQDIDMLKTYSGYPHVFNVCNALAALEILEKDFLKSKYIITYTRGLGHIIEKLAEMFIAAGGVIKTGWRVKEVSSGYNGYKFVIHGSGSVVKCNKVIVAICPKLIKGIFGYDICNIGEAVVKVPLMRVFAKGKALDIGKVPYTYVPGKIQRLGQMGKGVYQISYSSGEKATFWKGANKKKVIETFKDEWGKDLDGVVSIEKHYWDGGVHVWGKGWDGAKVWRSLMKYGADHGIYVIGEAVCPYQRWIESALWTAKKVADVHQAFS